MGHVILLAFAAALNPTLIAVTTVLLLLPSPKLLMFGYLCGALMTSITLGIVIVFALNGSSSTTSTTQHSLNPAVDLAIGGLMLVGALVLSGARTPRLSAWRERRSSKKQKGPPRWQRYLDRGSPRITFVVGAMLTLPGASYLLGLREIHELNYATAPTVLVIVGFNLIMLSLIEVPLLGYVFAPKWTPRAVARAQAWVGRHGHAFAVRLLLIVGALLVIKGIVGLSS